ncbi:uncharacterized protein LOC127256953 [Andrographis paniculata]|uniref:uncharacterized protein LOC127256953 n=1 Tax=Andrographis paniculata TaxID=175694 RepID=UPI0021E94A2D|nr:uncharacterized protein LOC127256953 [Andrographis paniculata]
MADIVNKFFIASVCMLAAPFAVLYGFKHKLLPGSADLSAEARTLWSGIVAVISVNVVIAFYIYMALKEPSGKHEPDPKFVADAKASMTQGGHSSNRSKQE